MSSIYYTDSGTGLPLVFIHGFCETHELWNEFILPFTKEYRVLTIDLPGFGKSPLPETDITIDTIALLIIDWLKDLKISKAVLIGHSLGGYVALSIAAQRPELVGGLGLFHSTTYADSEEKKINRNKVIAFVKKYGVAPYVETYMPGLFARKDNPIIPKTLAVGFQTDQKTLISYLKAMRDRLEKTFTLKSLDYPVIIVGGLKDTIIPVETLEEQVTFSVNSAFTILKHSAHMGMFEEKEIARDAIIGFASKCNSSI